MHAALDPADDALEAWTRWEASGADAMADPVAARWLPLVGWNLRGATVGETARAAFREGHRRVWTSNMRLSVAAGPALAALASADVPVIVLKGAALAWTVYDSVGLRPIGDVDILVQPGQLTQAFHALSSDGWRPSHPIADRDLLLRHAVNVWRFPHGAIDLHGYVLPESCWPGADDGLWQRARVIVTPEWTARRLSPADQLLHVCLHGLRWSPVHAAHWIADAVQILRREGHDLDWAVVVREATSRGLAFQMREALRLVQAVGRQAVPSATLAALATSPVSWADRVEYRAKGRSVVSVGGVFGLWRAWSRSRGLDGRRPPWLRYLAAAVGVGSRRQLIPWFARHARARLTRSGTGTPGRGLSSRTRLSP